MAQFGRPNQDIQTGDWTRQPSGFILNTALDETPDDDTDYVYSPNNLATTLELGLTSLSTPSVRTGHVLRYRIARMNNGTISANGNSTNVTASLYQGATLIASDTARATSGAWTTYVFNISLAAANNITDYSQLRVRFAVTASGGTAANRRGSGISWAELEIPNGTTFGDRSVSMTSTYTLNAVGDTSLSFSASLSGAGALSSVLKGNTSIASTLSSISSLTAGLQAIYDIQVSLDSTFDQAASLKGWADILVSVGVATDQSANLKGDTMISASISMNSEVIATLSGTVNRSVLMESGSELVSALLAEARIQPQLTFSSELNVSFATQRDIQYSDSIISTIDVTFELIDSNPDNIFIYINSEIIPIFTLYSSVSNDPVTLESKVTLFNVYEREVSLSSEVVPSGDNYTEITTLIT